MAEIIYDDARLTSIVKLIAAAKTAGNQDDVMTWEREARNTLYKINEADERERNEKTARLNKQSQDDMLALARAHHAYKNAVWSENYHTQLVDEKVARGEELLLAKNMLMQCGHAVNYEFNLVRIAEQKAERTNSEKEMHEAYCAFRNMAIISEFSYEKVKEIIASAPSEDANAVQRDLVTDYWNKMTVEARPYWRQ